MNNRLNFTNTGLVLFLFLLLAFLVFPAVGQSQNTERGDNSWTSIYRLNENSSFEAIREDFRSYWEGREIGKGHGYKPFKRWEAYMAPRIYPSNDMSLVNNTYFNYMKWVHKQEQSGETKSFAGNWTPMGPFTKATGEDTGVGRINMVRFDPLNNQVMYVGAANGGLWKSTDGGASWSTNTDFLDIIGVADLAIHPTVTTTMYMATGDAEGDRRSIGVLKTTDGGATWNPTGLSWTATDNFFIRNLIMDPTNSQVLLASTNNGVYRTTNGGVTWAAPTTITTQNVQDIAFKPGNPNVVYASGKYLWKSTDNGITFTRITNGVPSVDVERIAIAVTPKEPNWVYLMVGKASNQGLLGIYKSTNSGTSFSTQHEPDYSPGAMPALGYGSNINILGNDEYGGDAAGQAFFTAALAASPTDANFLLAGGVSQWASTDGGENWYISSYWAPDPNYYFVHADAHEIVFSPDGTKAYSSCDGGLSMYTDNASGDGAWTDLSNNLNISQQESIGMSANDPNLITAGLQDIGTILNTAPNTWKVIGGGDGEYNFIDRTNNSVIVETGTNGQHSRSTDGGLTFTDIHTGLPTDGTTGEVLFKSPIKQDPIVANTYYAGGRAHLYYSSNQGTTWTARGIPFPDGDGGGSNITEFEIAPSNNNIIYALDGFYMAKSVDAGVTWTAIAEPTASAAMSKIAVSNVDPNKVWVSCSGYFADQKVFKSVDGGATWTNLSSGLPNIPFNTIVFQNGSNDLVYVGADIGVYHRDASASEWTPFFDDLPRTQIKDLKIFYSAGRSGEALKVRAATFGRGTWQSDAVSSVLPVNLRSFTGVNEGKVNRLNWLTTEEIDLAYYDVQRSTDGISYTSIGRVLPLEGRAGDRSYDFDDESPEVGANYYRLKVTDLDGSFEYSRIITLFVDDSNSEISIFPNPAINVLKFKGLSETSATVRVMDALGRTLIVQTVPTAEGINISRLPNGTYYLEIRTGSNESVVKRFVKK
ncbi:T9SS type A sorting domain-containing protein [Neolewinella aurantiaca]|uniref:T9SS type A sorting domain-containing protein n=1 Tax=Neolewinella aurantiaca TaxID=2602767 RepID=A0A5C7FVA9_9BACT|nr:T9SS type A sorting domain-containing protein [Neolewinella aurantiaca]TXF89497.1 T9SS type A sorting domain-containing protein [Neolewinella aurantiaca]